MKITLDKGAIMPRREHSTDAGFDLFTPRRIVLTPHGSVTINTGVHIQLPAGRCGVVISKSGLLTKCDILSTGLVDEGYRGAIHIHLINHSGQMYTFERGEKVGQFFVTNYYSEELELVEELEETDRGNNGFGSTGRV